MDTNYKVKARDLSVMLSMKFVELAQHVCKLAGRPVRKPRSQKDTPPLIVALTYAISQLSNTFTVSTSGANFVDTVRLHDLDLFITFNSTANVIVFQTIYQIV